MHPYLGDFLTTQTVHLALNTSDLDAAPITLASGTVRVYRDDSTTEDDSGITLTADYDTRTGLHRVAIDLTSDGTFYAAAHDFFVVLTVGTVDGVSVVGKCIAHFSVQNRAPYLTLTAVIPDSVPSVGTRPTPLQALLMATRALWTRRYSDGASIYYTKEDGSTASGTFSQDHPTAPTNIARTA